MRGEILGFERRRRLERRREAWIVHVGGHGWRTVTQVAQRHRIHAGKRSMRGGMI